MWFTGPLGAQMLQKSVTQPWIARSADLRARSSTFDRSLAGLNHVVSTHLEDLRTESGSGYGRALAATVSVPSNDFDTTLKDLKTLGRTEGFPKLVRILLSNSPPRQDVSPQPKQIFLVFRNCSASAKVNSGTTSPWRRTVRKPMKPSTKRNVRIRG